MNIYACYVEPEKYPDFEVRPFPCVTHSALDNKIQFVSARFFPVDSKANRFVDIDKTISRYTENNSIGKCFWLNWKVIAVENIRELIDKIAERKMWIFGFWGFVPGEKADPSSIPWGEFKIPEDLNEYLFSKLGNHFLGYELGEQDGRFIASYICRQSSVMGEKSREMQYLKFHAFMNRIATNFYRHTVLLASLPFQHYFARSNTVSFLGCAAAQALPNPQIWYSFVRGASKQYGLLCFGDVSVWNRWGYKTFSSVKTLSKDDSEVGMEYGTSLSLIKRLIYSQYMYNNDLLGVEQSWFYDDDIERHIDNTADEVIQKNEQLSPIGQLQQSVNGYVQKHGKPGAMYTPVAIVMDCFSGWVPPRTLFSKSLFQVWGSLPYNSGDFQTHELFSMLYPGYENSGFFHNETGFLTSTPYGEIADVILSDTPIEILRQYKTALLVNDTSLDYEFYRKLREYVSRGGHIFLFAGLIYNNSFLEKFDPEYYSFFGVCSEEKTQSLTNSTICYGGKDYQIASIPVYTYEQDNSHIIAETQEGIPVAVQRDYGSGKITIFLTKDGLVRSDYSPMLYNDTDSYIFSPYSLMPFVKAIYTDAFNDLRLIYPDNQALQYIVDVPDEKSVNILVNNNTYLKQCFDFESELNIKSITENNIGCDLHNTIGYYPPGAEINNTACNGDGLIELESGATKLFHAVLNERLKIEPALYPEKPSARYFVSIPENFSSPLDFVLLTPTLRQHFQGLVIDARYIEQTDISTVQKQADELKTLGMELIVDFSSLLNHYPDFSFCAAFEERRDESYRRLDSIIEKVFCYPCTAVILSAIQNPEGNSDTRALKDSMLELLKHVSDKVENSYIRVIVQNTPIFFNTEELYKFLTNSEGAEIGYNCGAGIATETPWKEILNSFYIPFFIACAPYSDSFGQFYNTRMPVAGSQYLDSILQAATEYRKKGGNMFILNCRYSNYSEIYADFEVLEKGQQPL